MITDKESLYQLMVDFDKLGLTDLADSISSLIQNKSSDIELTTILSYSYLIDKSDVEVITKSVCLENVLF